MRGLGKYLPVTSSKKQVQYGKAGYILKAINGSPTPKDRSMKRSNGNAGTQRENSSDQSIDLIGLNGFFEHDQPVVKNHGNPDFVESGKRRSRKKHRSNRTEPVLTQSQIIEDGAMATLDTGLQNMRKSTLKLKSN